MVNKPGVLTTLAALVLAASIAGLPGQEVEKKAKDRIETTRDGTKSELADVLRRLKQLELDVDVLRRQLTIDDLQTATQQAARAVCKIEVDGSSGSGFVLDISPEQAGKKYDPTLWYVQSAYHVMKNEDGTRRSNVRVSMYPSTQETDQLPIDNAIYVGAGSYADDLVVFTIPKKDVNQKLHGLPIRNLTADPLSPGAGHVGIMLGFPHNKFAAKPIFISHTDAPWLLSPHKKDSPTVRVLEFPAGPAESVPGNSGGPLVLPRVVMKDGKRTIETAVGGMVTAVHNKRHLTGAIRSEYFLDFLRKNEILGEVKKESAPKKKRETSQRPPSRERREFSFLSRRNPVTAGRMATRYSIFHQGGCRNI